MFTVISSIQECQNLIDSNQAVLIYFSNEQCNVCKVLLPKVEKLVESKFPKIKGLYCNTIKNPEIPAQNQIFTIPTILVYFEGKEFLRKSRNIGMTELEEALLRPYSMI